MEDIMDDTKLLDEKRAVGKEFLKHYLMDGQFSKEEVIDFAKRGPQEDTPEQAQRRQEFEEKRAEIGSELAKWRFEGQKALKDFISERVGTQKPSEVIEREDYKTLSSAAYMIFDCDQEKDRGRVKDGYMKLATEEVLAMSDEERAKIPSLSSIKPGQPLSDSQVKACFDYHRSSMLTASTAFKTLDMEMGAKEGGAKGDKLAINLTSVISSYLVEELVNTAMETKPGTPFFEVHKEEVIARIQTAATILAATVNEACANHELVNENIMNGNVQKMLKEEQLYSNPQINGIIQDMVNHSGQMECFDKMADLADKVGGVVVPKMNELNKQLEESKKPIQANQQQQEVRQREQAKAAPAPKSGGRKM